MKVKKDSPGVYVPPPLFYILTFVVAILMQKVLPITDTVLQSSVIKTVGILFLLIAVFFSFSSLRQFFLTKNTLVLIKPATSLQTGGIYSISRNPMYTGLAFTYLGLTCFIGNWWNIIFFPFLLIIIQEYVIKREERYLGREFGQQYIDYKNKVRRWL